MTSYKKERCQLCGRVLRKYEFDWCEECEENLSDTKMANRLEKDVTDWINSCYISKTRLRRILNDYAIRKNDNTLVIKSELYEEFVKEIIKLAGYKNINWKEKDLWIKKNKQKNLKKKIMKLQI